MDFVYFTQEAEHRVLSDEAEHRVLSYASDKIDALSLALILMKTEGLPIRPPQSTKHRRLRSLVISHPAEHRMTLL